MCRPSQQTDPSHTHTTHTHTLPWVTFQSNAPGFSNFPLSIFMKTFSALALIILSTFSHLLNVIDTLATMIISSSCIQHVWCKCAHHHTFLIPCGRPVLTSTLGTEGRRETQKAQGRREDVRGRRTGQIDLILNSKSFDSPNKHYLVHGYDWIFFF